MNAWSGIRVLVTGAGGFIGSHLVERLARAGASVTAFTHYHGGDHEGQLVELPADLRATVRVVAGDVTDPYAVASAVDGQAVVFHLAALIGIPYSYVAPASYVDVNVKGTLNVLEACRRYGTIRLVHTSTSETYGTAQYTPIDERHPLVGQSPYSASKIAADKMVESYVRSFGVHAATVRPFNTYGPRQTTRAVIPTVLSQLLAGGPVRLGALSPVRDFVYVEDTAEAFLALGAADGVDGEVVNLGTGSGISIGDLVQLAGRVVGVSPRIETEEARLRPEQSEVFALVANARRAEELVGWHATVALEEGLARTAAWLRAHPVAAPDRYAL
jgi:NAD dependent epimerase/dehydratase